MKLEITSGHEAEGLPGGGKRGKPIGCCWTGGHPNKINKKRNNRNRAELICEIARGGSICTYVAGPMIQILQS